jgi:chemotaxis signal transduction protein
LTGTYVRLRTGGEAYAVPVGEVLEVVPLGAVDAVPGAPAASIGVCALRGQPLPVFDLARLLGLQAETGERQILVSAHAGGRIGWAVDTVTDVGELPSGHAEAQSPWLRSTVLADGELVGVVDLTALVARLHDEARG